MTTEHAPHTPGPWRVEVDGAALPQIRARDARKTDGTIIAVVRSYEEADARLIAAAPALLAALELIEQLAYTGPSASSYADRIDEIEHQARAALAQVRVA